MCEHIRLIKTIKHIWKGEYKATNGFEINSAFMFVFSISRAVTCYGKMFYTIVNHFKKIFGYYELDEMAKLWLSIFEFIYK